MYGDHRVQCTPSNAPPLHTGALPAVFLCSLLVGLVSVVGAQKVDRLAPGLVQRCHETSPFVGVLRQDDVTRALVVLADEATRAQASRLDRMESQHQRHRVLG